MVLWWNFKQLLLTTKKDDNNSWLTSPYESENNVLQFLDNNIIVPIIKTKFATDWNTLATFYWNFANSQWKIMSKIA